MFPPFLSTHVIYPLHSLFNPFRHSVRQFFKEFQDSQWFSCDWHKEQQQAKLAALCQDAYDRVPYYRRLFDRLHVNLKEITLELLKELPVLERSHIRDNFADLINTRFKKEDLFRCSSGGSTGEPVHVMHTNHVVEVAEAHSERGKSWTGWRPGYVHHYFWGAPADIKTMSSAFKTKMWDFLYNRRFVDAFETSEALFERYYNLAKRRPPQLLESYSNILYEFAKFIEARKLSRLEINAVISSAGTLYDFQRDLISRTVGRGIFNRYGCRELGPIAHECETHEGMHINMERYIVEIERQDNDGVGSILITDLENFAFPLIRYRIGDQGKMSEAKCSCGRELIKLVDVVGRSLDIVITPEGNRISGELFPHVFKDFDEIILGQVVQHSINEVEVRLTTKEPLVQERVQMLLGMIKRYTGPSMVVRLNLTDRIIITPTGKYRPVISKVSQ